MERSPLDLTSNLRKFSEASIVDLTEDEIQLIEEDHPPSKKIKQNIQDDQEPLHEKRPSSYRSHPSKTLKENISKAQSQGLRLIQQKYHVEDSLEREFIILGVNGNVYNTKISCRPSCNCENNKSGANRTHCEHICFVFLKIFRLSASDARIFQKDLLTTELKSILNSFTSVPPSVLADPTVTEKYLEIMGTERSRKVKKTVNQKKIEGDCLVCFEPLDSSEDLVYCKYSCGNNIHKKCFERWKETRKEESCELKCVHCRARWDQDRESLRNAHTKNGFLNLSEYQDRTFRDFHPSYFLLLPELLRFSWNIINPSLDSDDDNSDF